MGRYLNYSRIGFIIDAVLHTHAEVNSRMANSETRVTSTGTETTILPDRSRYDFHLLAFPILFGAGAGAAMLTELPVEIGLLVAAVIGMLVMLDGLFRHPPTTN